MTAARLTRAEARAIGVDPGGAGAGRTTRGRRQAAGPHIERCHTCGETLHGETAATRHNTLTRHYRYDLTLEAPGCSPAQTTASSPANGSAG